MNSFANQLRNTRIRAGLTQMKLANLVGVDNSYISKIERGIYNPPARDKVLAMAEVLGIKDRAQHAYFLLAAGCAGLDDLEDLKMESNEEDVAEKSLPFAHGALNYPDTSVLEEENLIERIRLLLKNPRISRDERQEYVKLIRSFVTWLEFQIPKDHE
jgi:transcriptional regulator with XRE-family HTH domain